MLHRQSGLTMTTTEITLKEAKALTERVTEALHKDEAVTGKDLALLRSAMDTWVTIAAELLDGHMSLRRLREILGAPAPAPGQPSTKEDNVETKSDDAQTEGEAAPPDAQDDKKRNAHHPGRRSAKDHPEAEAFVHEHPTHHSGQRCDEAGCSGRLYHFKKDGEFRTLLRISGGAPLRAETHQFKDLRCNQCGKVYAVPAPKALSDDGPAEQMYGFSATATVALYKYLGGTPWYRQGKLQNHLGLDVSPSTQWDLCEALANAAFPLYAKMQKLAAAFPLFFADDISFPILSEKDGEIKKRRSTGKDVHRDGCHSSCIIADDQAGRRLVLFKTGIIHAGEWMDLLLSQRPSGLSPPLYMADRSTSNPVTVTATIELACNAHLRNRFDELRNRHKLLTGRVLDLYKKVYKVAAASGAMPAAARLAHLQKEATPLMDKIFAIARSELGQHYTEPNSQLGKAFQYALNHEPELRGFLKYPGAPLDNNLCESMLSRVDMLRRNAWFYKNMVGAWVSDVIMSLGQTAKLVDANPYNYYLQILRHQETVRQDPASFMPWNYQQTIASLSQRTAAVS
jgi:transposase